MVPGMGISPRDKGSSKLVTLTCCPGLMEMADLFFPDMDHVLLSVPISRYKLFSVAIPSVAVMENSKGIMEPEFDREGIVKSI
jgi:hypothetical protein